MAPEEALVVAPKGVWGDALMALRIAPKVALEGVGAACFKCA